MGQKQEMLCIITTTLTCREPSTESFCRKRFGLED